MEKKEQIGHIVDLFAKVIALIVSLSLALSFLWDWAFFKACGLKFSQIPMSIEDHAQGVLIWAMPATITGGGLYFIGALLTARVEQGLTEEEIVKSSPNPSLAAARRRRPWIFILAMCVLITVSYMFFGDSFFVGAWSVGIPGTWIVVANWLNSHPRIIQRRSAFIRVLIEWVPIILWYVFATGYLSARSLLENSNPKQTIYLSGSSQPVIPATVLRTLDRGVLIEDKDTQHIAFIPWPSIRRIVENEKPHEVKYQGLACEYFHLCMGNKLSGKPIKAPSAGSLR